MAPDAPKKKQKREKRSLSEVKTLGQQLLSSRAHINNLPILLTFISPDSPPQYALESLLSLQSFFTPLVAHLPSAHSNPDSGTNPDPDVIYFTWLRSKFDEFIRLLIDLVTSSHCEDALNEVVLDSIMEFVKVGNAEKFHSAIYHKLIRAMLVSELGVFDVLLDLLAEKYLNYFDVGYFTYITLEKQALTLERKDGNIKVDVDNNLHSKPSIELSIQKMYKLLSRIPPFEVSEENIKMWNDSGTLPEKSNNQEGITSGDKHTKFLKSSDKVLSSKSASKKMKLKFTKAWMSFLRLSLPLDVYKEVLVTLHQAVIPQLSNPIMLS